MLQKSLWQAVLRIREVYPGSGNFSIQDPGSSRQQITTPPIQNHITAIEKILNIFNPKYFTKLSEIPVGSRIRKNLDPESSARDPKLFFSDPDLTLQIIPTKLLSGEVSSLIFFFPKRFISF